MPRASSSITARAWRRATQHLLDLGHREIALIVGGPQRPASERRGARRRDRRPAGCRCVVYDGPFSLAYGERAAREILDASQRSAPIIAGGNVLMHGALRSLRARGLRLGADLSFVGCDDVLVAELHAPQIAVVRRDMSSMGVAAAELLLERMATAAGTREIVLPTEFVLRPSCGLPCGARALTAAHPCKRLHGPHIVAAWLATSQTSPSRLGSARRPSAACSTASRASRTPRAPPC